MKNVLYYKYSSIDNEYIYIKDDKFEYSSNVMIDAYIEDDTNSIRYLEIIQLLQEYKGMLRVERIDNILND